MRLEQSKAVIVLRSSSYGFRLIGAGCVAAGFYVFLHFLNPAHHIVQVLFTAARACPFIGGGLLALCRADSKTEFNMRSRHIALWRRSPVGRVKYYKIGSSEIASLGLVQYPCGAPSRIEVTLKNGTRYKVASGIVRRDATYKIALDRMRDAMGLAQGDRRGHFAEFFEWPPRIDWQRV